MGRIKPTQIVVCLLLGLLSTACSTESRMIKLQGILSDYQRSIRWSDFQAASGFLDTPTARLSWQQAASYENIKVTQYLIKTREPNEDGTDYHQSVEIRYYEEPSVTVKTLVDHQHWQFDEQRQTWRLVGSLPPFH
jgi:hypothetical protein